MKYTSNKHERESDSKNSFNAYISTTQSIVMKRLLLLIISVFMVFAAAQSTPTTQASSSRCDMVCTQYIDPTDGQCYIACCPRDEACKMPCERTPCK